jgi:hypothetical protein
MSLNAAGPIIAAAGKGIFPETLKNRQDPRSCRFSFRAINIKKALHLDAYSTSPLYLKRR